MKRLMFLIATLAFAMILSGTITFADEKTEPTKPTVPAVEKNAVPPAKVELVDINTATEDQLKALPGIGEDHVKKIIANRPYVKKEDLKFKGIIPDTIYELIKDRITADIKAER